MLWKVFFIQLLAFFTALVSCKLINNALERYFFNGKYKIKKSFSYFIAAVIMLMVGMLFGKDMLYCLL